MQQTRLKKPTQEWVLEHRNRQEVRSTASTERRCEKCNHFDNSLVDLRKVGTGLCKKFPPFNVMVGNRHGMTWVSDFPEIEKTKVCGQFERKY